MIIFISKNDQTHFIVYTYIYVYMMRNAFCFTSSEENDNNSSKRKDFHFRFTFIINFKRVKITLVLKAHNYKQNLCFITNKLFMFYFFIFFLNKICKILVFLSTCLKTTDIGRKVKFSLTILLIRS